MEWNENVLPVIQTMKDIEVVLNVGIYSILEHLTLTLGFRGT